MTSLRQGLLCAFMFCMAACGGDAAEHDAGMVTVDPLLTEPLADVPDREVRLLEVSFPPGASSPAHHHPGQVIVHVTQGAVLSGLDGAEPTRFTQGQSWTEKPGQVHSSSRNASETEPAKLLVFLIAAPGAPVLEPEK